MQGSSTQLSPSEDLRSFYARVRKGTEELCLPLEIEDYIPQPVVDVSPPKWNIAHTTWFFEEMILKRFVPGYKVFDPDFGFLFNSYYNSIGDRTARDHRGDLSRPTVENVFAYRRFVDEKMDELLTSTDKKWISLLDQRFGTQRNQLVEGIVNFTFVFAFKIFNSTCLAAAHQHDEDEITEEHRLNQPHPVRP